MKAETKEKLTIIYLRDNNHIPYGCCIAYIGDMQGKTPEIHAGWSLMGHRDMVNKVAFRKDTARKLAFNRAVNINHANFGKDIDKLLLSPLYISDIRYHLYTAIFLTAHKWAKVNPETTDCCCLNLLDILRNFGSLEHILALH